MSKGLSIPIYLHHSNEDSDEKAVGRNDRLVGAEVAKTLVNNLVELTKCVNNRGLNLFNTSFIQVF